jgi:hypothetical protein
MHVERQYPRYALEAEVVVHHEGAPMARGRTANVSRGGLCANVAGPLPRGTAVEVELALVFENEQFSEPLVVPARVVWCTQIGGGWQLGMSFLALGPDRARYLELFLRFLSDGQAALDGDHGDGDGDDDPFGR